MIVPGVRLVSILLMSMVLASAASAAPAPKKLPALGGDPAKVSVSGLSSGAFMAVQYDVAFSASTMGAGVVAGGPYNCVYVNFGGIFTCMQGSPLGTASYGAAQAFAALGQVDPVEGLKSQRIYLFSGQKDGVIKSSVMDATLEFFKAANIPEANIQYVKQVAAGHAFVSDDFGGACDVTASPFVNQCQVDGALYDQPHAILTQIYGPLPQPKATTLSAAPVAFDQGEFASSLSGLAKVGYVYAPKDCAKGAKPKCAVHVVFHGCAQGAGEVGDAVYGRLGFNEWADSNRTIVLYPQVEASNLPYNPKGCWDWWGYSGLSFQTQAGPQLSAVRAMVKRLTGP